MTNLLKGVMRQDVRTYLLENLGLNFSEKQDEELLKKLKSASDSFGYANFETFINWLLSTSLTTAETSKLATYLTIGETYFMREKKGYDFLEHIYLPGLIHKRLGAAKKLRIWCAGCATGEEAYSLAIVLLQSIPFIHEWDISIIATDVNGAFLEKARKGVYTKWSFRNNTPDFVERYFTTNDEKSYQIKPEIQKMVSFEYHNLANEIDADFTNKFDIVFCRNVLIYFSNEGINKVTNRIYNSLAEGGVLVVSPFEMSNMISARFSTIYYAGFTIYHKNSSREAINLIKHRKGKPLIVRQAHAEKKINKKIEQQKVEFAAQKSKNKIPSKVGGYGEISSDINELFRKGQFKELEALLIDTVENNTNPSANELLLMTKTKANLGKLSEALIWAEKLRNIDKLNANVYYLMATILQEIDEPEQAIASLKTALYLEPNFVLAHFLLGTLASKKGELALGKRAYKNALSSLEQYDSEDILPESDGITAGRFIEMIHTISN